MVFLDSDYKKAFKHWTNESARGGFVYKQTRV